MKLKLVPVIKPLLTTFLKFGAVVEYWISYWVAPVIALQDTVFATPPVTTGSATSTGATRTAATEACRVVFPVPLIVLVKLIVS